MYNSVWVNWRCYECIRKGLLDDKESMCRSYIIREIGCRNDGSYGGMVFFWCR